MADAFRERTARLLTDYLEYCAREPGTAARQPSSPEAAVLRCVAAQIREYNVRTLSVYRGFRWNRVELVAWMAQKKLASPRGPNWYRVASLLTFAGMLLERHPREACGRKKKEGNVSRDCRLLVALLCAQLSGQHRTWLLANGGWDGFCLFFQGSLQQTWTRHMVWVFVSYCTAVVLLYLWRKLL
uniref:Bcl-2-like protein 10 n=1 Tax=Sus scrofa TaxID=9823 RepID=A0A8D1ITC0_PIG